MKNKPFTRRMASARFFSACVWATGKDARAITVDDVTALSWDKLAALPNCGEKTLLEWQAFCQSVVMESIVESQPTARQREIKRLYLKERLTLREVASKTGISFQGVSWILKGQDVDLRPAHVHSQTPPQNHIAK